MARDNRRNELLDAARELFDDRGYEGTSIAALAEATDMTKAAFVYHFSSKEDLLFELSEPLLDELDEVLNRAEEQNRSAQTIQTALADYLQALCRHRDVAAWVDGDKSILKHSELGARLTTNNQRAHRLLCGSRPSKSAQAKASAVLGMLWRPIRNGYLGDDAKSRQAVIELATQAARAL